MDACRRRGDTDRPGWSAIDGGKRLPFVVVNSGYLAATCADSLLAPIFPVAAPELDLRLESAGFAFALIATAIAIGNVVGGALLTRGGPKLGAGLGLSLASVGGGIAASADTAGPFLFAQGLLGLGSGLYFASGLWAAGALAGDRRRGLAMGFYGVAFSGGLATAALLAALGAVHGWPVAFVGSAVISGAAAVAILLVRMPGRPARRHESTEGWHRALGVPLAVGGMAAASQYGTNSFLPTFAVTAWGVAPSSAAVMLAAARIASVPAKLVAGHRSDRRGTLPTAAAIGGVLALLGAGWTLAPGVWVGVVPAILFAAGVSGLGPVTNVLGLEAFGHRGTMLGLFRSLQIAIGAATSAVIGLCTTWFGLRPTLVVAAVVPVALVTLRRRARRPSEPVAD